ncbi:MAG TPA: COX15/CtaA family protein [Candidatus Eisenbacteria bacterium]|nr:COX15/CtaA family protein [Candidatus Eisenbacteria bacterium]
MSVSAKFRFASQLGLATVVLMYALIVLGSIVRTTGSGLACPDWPLCQGRLFPPLEMNAMIEWFHRLAALLVSLLLAATTAWIAFHRELRARLGALAGTAMLLLCAQILLGALTVWKLLDPAIVGGHLAVALLLFSSVVMLTLVAGREASEATMPEPRPVGLFPALGLASLLIYGQAVIGGMVSASGASLACPDWPTCAGEWLPPMHGLVGIHMAHRLGAYMLTAYLVVVAWMARRSGDPLVASVGPVLLGLTLGQVVLGVLNIWVGIQVWLSALHLANATGMLAVAIATTFRVASMPRRVALPMLPAS